MPKPRPSANDEFAPEIEARSLADHAVGLAMAPTLARDERHGVWADAARYELGLVREQLAKIEGALAKMPTALRGKA